MLEVSKTEHFVCCVKIQHKAVTVLFPHMGDTLLEGVNNDFFKVNLKKYSF